MKIVNPNHNSSLHIHLSSNKIPHNTANQPSFPQPNCPASLIMQMNPHKKQQWPATPPSCPPSLNGAEIPKRLNLACPQGFVQAGREALNSGDSLF